jgi:apolipoprotein N-acyltransferase
LRDFWDKFNIIDIAYFYISVIRILFFRRYRISAFLLGCFTVFALPPINCLILCFFTFPLLVLLLDDLYKESLLGRRKCSWFAALTGWQFGFGYFSAGLWWLGKALLLSGVFYGAIPFSVIGLTAFLALFYAFACYLAFLLWDSSYRRIIAFAFSFALAEWLRAWMFTGFPWNAIAYTAMPCPFLMQPVVIFGIYGMNYLSVVLYASAVLFLKKEDWNIGFSVLFLLCLGDILFGLYRFKARPFLERSMVGIRIVQPFLHDANDDVAMRLYNFERLLSLTKRAPLRGAKPSDFIIWPETSVPYILEDVPLLLRRIGNALQEKQLAFIGTIRVEKRKEDQKQYFFNSLRIINSKSVILSSVDKVHLVPFGEYLPFASFFQSLGFGWLLQLSGLYTPGAKKVLIPLKDGPIIWPLICYESIFPLEEIYEGPQPDLLLNITNDIWLGETPGPWQHFYQARLRAVEEGLFLVRVANNGISAVINPYGKITAMIGYNKSGFIDIDIPKKKSKRLKVRKVLIFIILMSISFFMLTISKCLFFFQKRFVSLEKEF